MYTFINVFWILKAVLDLAVESTENIRTGLAVAASMQTGEQHVLILVWACGGEGVRVP